MNTALDTTLEHRATIHATGSTTRPPRKGAPMRRTITIIAATIALLIGLVAVAQARGAGFEVQRYEEGLFYGDSDQQILLFAGATTEDFCNENEPTHTARVFSHRDGSVDIKVDASTQPIYLYSGDDPFALLEETCKAMASDTVPPQPFAEGDGLVRMRIEIAPDGTRHVVNSTVGAVSSADGTTWRVRGWADLMIGEFGPIGDPAEFQGLRATMTGR